MYQEFYKRNRTSVGRYLYFQSLIEKMDLQDDPEKKPHGQDGHLGYKRLTLQEVISRFERVHEDKYCYSKVNYKNANTEVTVHCKHHGNFTIRPVQHWRGKGCDKCS